jgi:hypothetical protein
MPWMPIWNSNGKYEVDDIDLMVVSRHHWFVNTRGHLSTSIGNKTVYLGQFIAQRMGLNLEGMQVDHKDQNKLNNKRNNIRLATRSQNGANRKVLSNNKLGIKGVYFREELGKYVASIRVNKKLIHLGYFTDKNEASNVYNQAAIKYFGEFACLNS